MEQVQEPDRVRAFMDTFFDDWSTAERRRFFELVADRNIRSTVAATLTAESITEALAMGGNIEEASKLLGCSRRTLQTYMRKFGMPASKGGRPMKHGVKR